jgi:hypothetical protein
LEEKISLIPNLHGFMTLGYKGVAWGDGAVTWSDTGYKKNI